MVFGAEVEMWSGVESLVLKFCFGRASVLSLYLGDTCLMFQIAFWGGVF